MHKYIVGGTLCAVAFLSSSPAARAEETVTTVANPRDEMMVKIQGLMKMIADLQAKLAEARGEVSNIARELGLGAEGSDVKEVQEILATDPTLFKAKPTGYFGPLTEEAIKKFQEHYGLAVTGKIDEPTRTVIHELKMEKKNGVVPPGLVRSHEVKERIKSRLREKWKDCDFEMKFRASVCEKIKDKRNVDENHEDDNDDDNEDVTRDDARRALVDAQNEINQFRDSIDEMEDEDVDAEDVENAKKTLRDAQKEMKKARRNFARNNFADSYESSKDVIEILGGEDELDDEQLADDPDSDDSDNDDEEDT